MSLGQISGTTNPPDFVTTGVLRCPSASESMIRFTSAKFKYNEVILLQQLAEYVASTYGQHYVGGDNTQAMDLIISAGHGVGFTVGDIIKYASRLYKKGDRDSSRKDILKILHYALFLLYIHDTGQ